MQYLASASNASRQKADCVVVGIYDKNKLNAAGKEIDAASNGYLGKLAKAGDLPSSLGQTTLLQTVPGVSGKRVLVAGLGEKSKFCIKQLDTAVAASIKAAANTSSKSIVFYLAANGERFSDAERVTHTVVASAQRALYRFDQLKSKKPTNTSKINTIGLGFDSRAASNKAKQQFAIADAIAEGVSLTRDLGNFPANICTPEYLAKTAQELARKNKSLTTRAYGLQDIKKLKMGAFLSVTQGAKRPPRLIVMNYKGASAKEAPVVLVGKGITFDTGGISLKPPAAMDEMKYDMCGAGTVLGVFRALVSLNLPINVIGIIAACENMPSSTATRPGDVVTSMSGKTIEVLNTDAEGRLVLCDALTYAKKFKPKTIIDIATLTGACVIALGENFSGLMTPHDKLANDLLDAGTKAGDTAWRLPVNDDYLVRLKTNFADISNVGGRPAGAITAACFLSQFMQGENWAHLDIAGSAWISGPQKGATGRPVSLLVQYLLDQ